MESSVLSVDVLKRRIQILTRGCKTPELRGEPIPGYLLPGFGAGPQGRRFTMVHPDPNQPVGMMSVPFYPPDHRMHESALGCVLGKDKGTLVLEDGTRLRAPTVLRSARERLSDGTPATRSFVSMHSYNTLCAVLAYTCTHFRNGTPCRYCELESVGRQELNFPEKFDHDLLAENVELFVRHDPVRSLTLTSGTFSDPDDVVREFVELVARIRNRVGISIHVQHEPVSDLGWIQRLANVTDTVGIFLEIFNEQKRREICPGKAKISEELYLENWKEAVKHFGKGNVLTTCLLGFGVDFDEICDRTASLAAMGVRTILLPVRPRSRMICDVLPTHVTTSVDDLVELHLKVARIQVEHGLKRSPNAAGCIGCNGCSAMNEALALAEHELSNKSR